jgi:hypothetical protein
VLVEGGGAADSADGVSAYISTAQTGLSTEVIITGWTEDWDDGSEFNASTGVFTSATAGRRCVRGKISSLNVDDTRTWSISLYHTPNGGSETLVDISIVRNATGLSDRVFDLEVSKIIDFAVGDVVTIKTAVNSGTFDIYAADEARSAFEVS